MATSPTRRRLVGAICASLALVAVSGAAGEAIVGYTATGAPTRVKPSTPASYTIALTNTSATRAADRARVSIPQGFTVAPASVQASATCGAAAWTVELPVPTADGKIAVRRPGGSANNLCPGGVLTIAFTATSSSVEGSFTWATELLRDVDTFVLGGPDPSVTVDGTAPAVALTSKPPNPSNDPSPSFAFAADEPASFACKLDAGTFAPCTSPQGFGGLADGSHTFTVRATDAAGNTRELAYTWLIETNLPVVVLTAQPSAASSSSAAEFAFTASKPATFECRLDGGAFESCTSPRTYASLANGPHTFRVKATDAATNVGPETVYTWTVDTVSPVVTITQKPGNPSNVASPVFQFSASEAVAFQCKLDGGAFAACSSPKAYTPGDGAHAFTVKATDAAGNTGEAVHTWTIDTIAPTPRITQSPPPVSNVSASTFAFDADEPASFVCKLDGSSFTSCASPKSYTPADGSHTFTVRAVDPAGNTGEASYVWAIDTIPPTATITTKPTNPSNVKSPAFEFSASEPSGLQCKLDQGAFAACTSPKAYSDLSDGSHTFTVKATDAAGNAGEAVTTWTIDTVAPTATITQKPNNPSNVKSPEFRFSVSGADSIQCRLDQLAFAACTSPRQYTNLADGVHAFAVRASDAAGNTAEATYEWLLETDLPIVTFVQVPEKLTQATAGTFAFTSEVGATFECRLDGPTFVPCSSPRAFNGLADGSHAFAVRATNAAASTGPETLYTWSIDTTGPTAAITAKPTDPTNARSAQFEFSASEAGATYQCRLDDAAFALCASPHAYVGLGDGRHTFAVRAIDAAANLGADAVYSWTVETRAPFIAISSEPTALAKSSTAIFAFASDRPATYQCNVDGRGYEPCSSPASYAGLQDGPHTFAVRATDAAGNVGTVTRSWTIDSTAPETTIDSGPVARTSATTAAFRFSAGEPATFECELDGGAFAPCSSPKTYRPLAPGAHSFAVRAVDAAGNVDATPSVSRWTVAPVTRKVTGALFSPAAGQTVTQPPLLRWRAVRRATYYNVQLYRGARKILTAWPKRTRFQLLTRWKFGGRVQRLQPGAYRWYVWPGFGRTSARRYGSLLGTSTFVVARGGR